jgi:uncharacterized protein YbaA (DUF1428 family)
MSYIDGFVIVVPKKNIAAYKKMAQLGRKIWMEHGALQYFECVGNDLKTKWGVPFPKLTKAKKNETVFFSFIIYKSRKHRDAVNKKVMADKRMKMDNKKMPFDMKRFSYGGFKAVVEG